MKTVYRVNPMLDVGQVVIWGTRSNGKTAYKMLTESGIKVNMAGFRRLIREYAIEETHLYIKDLSHIYDVIYNVYHDFCHVHEFGNKMIALEIYKHIADGISTWKKKI